MKGIIKKKNDQWASRSVRTRSQKDEHFTSKKKGFPGYGGKKSTGRALHPELFELVGRRPEHAGRPKKKGGQKKPAGVRQPSHAEDDKKEKGHIERSRERIDREAYCRTTIKPIRGRWFVSNVEVKKGSKKGGGGGGGGGGGEGGGGGGGRGGGGGGGWGGGGGGCGGVVGSEEGGVGVRGGSLGGVGFY